MALNGDARRSPEHWHGKPPMHSSFDSWLSKNGKDAYKTFVNDHPKTDLSYEAWRQTDRVYGGYLFYIASLVWAEDGDSDEENVKRRRISRVHSDSKKTATTNGNGAHRTAGSATPTPATNSDEIGASGKRKRKPRKKYMSQELVASDEEATDEIDAATPPAEVQTPAIAEAAANGRRKSSSRKPRKKPISDETVLSEDENDDAMEIDTQVIDSPLPVRSAPRTSAAFRVPESPKKASPKQASVKKSRKSFLVRLPFHLWDAVNLEEKSEEMVLDEDAETGDASIAEVSRPATTPAPKTKSETSNNPRTDTHGDEDVEALTAEGTPDPNTRRGLRNRKPAQQRPYYHDAQVFEDVETEPDDESGLESVSREQSPEPAPSRPKHFKGKGRAWKKDDSDEDEEFITPKEKKAAKAAKAKAEREKTKGEDITWALMDALDADLVEMSSRTEQTNGSPKDAPKQKKAKKPRKSSLLGDDLTRNELDNSTPTQPVKRGRGRPRKSALSSEIVRDDSDEEAKAESANTTAPIDLTTPPTSKPTSRPSTATSTAPATTPRKRGRPRKSETISTSAKASAKASEDAEEATHRRSSTATEVADPKSAPAAVVEDHPLPATNREAALVEALYSREKSEGVRGLDGSAEADTESTHEAGPAAAPQHPSSSTETSGAEGLPHAGIAEGADAKAEEKAEAGAESGAGAGAEAQARQSSPPPSASSRVKQEDEVGGGDAHEQNSNSIHTRDGGNAGIHKDEHKDNNVKEIKDTDADQNEDADEDAQSAAMSLGSSSDGEL